MKKKSTVMSYKDIMMLEVEGEPFLWEGYLPKGKLAALVGQADIGKSYFALDLCRAICNGDETFLGSKLKTQHNSSIYVSFEDYPEDHKRRFIGADEEKLKNMEGFRAIYDHSDDVIQQLDEELTERKADLIVIDPLGDVFKGDLNDGIKVRSFLNKFKNLSKKHGCAFLFNHHIPKSKVGAKPGKYDAIGSEAITSCCRTILHISEHEIKDRVLTVTKGNHLSNEQKNKGLVLSFNTEDLYSTKGERHDFNTKMVKAKNDPELLKKIMELHKEGIGVRDISTQLKEGGNEIGKSTIGEIIKQFKEKTGNDSKESEVVN